MKKFKGAIFDMDGTLLDSMHIWQGLAPEYLKRNNIAVPEHLAEQLSAMSVRRAADYLINNFGLTIAPEELHDELIAILEEYYRYHAVFKPGAVSFLQKLLERQVKTVVLSATPEHLLRLALARMDALKYFSAGLLSCSSIGFSKSRREAFFAAVQHLGLAPYEVMVFEDAWYAASTAKNAGFTVTVMADEHEAKTAEMRALADFYIEKSWDEFPLDRFF